MSEEEYQYDEDYDETDMYGGDDQLSMPTKSFKMPFIICLILTVILTIILIIEAVLVVKNKTKKSKFNPTYEEYDCPCKKAAEAEQFRTLLW